MAIGLELLVAALLLTALVVGGVAQLLAVYHFVRYLAAQTPGQRWGLAALGPLSLLWRQGLSEAALSHRKRFLRWEAIFLLCAGVAFTWDALLRQPNSAAQNNAFRPASNAPAPTAPGRER
jgi:hypothetical protein